MIAPLRLSLERTWLYGLALIALCLVQVRFVAAQRFGDWSAFWAAAATAGTADLVDARRHEAWMAQHHLHTTIFPYLPGAAWFLLPVKVLPLAAGYALNFAVMAAIVAAAAIVASRTYRIPRALSMLFAFAWAPTIAALATGQISPMGLLLAMVAIAACAAGSPVLCGLAVGLMLYKITYAIPFLVLLLARRELRALAVVAACAACWYVMSAAAAGGNWHWPVQYADALRSYAAADARFNALKAISIPSLLLRAGVAPAAAVGAGAVVLLIAFPLLRRLPALEAASFAPLAGLAASPHTLPYDLTLMLPAFYYAAVQVQEPARTRAICAMYLLAPLWLLSGVARFDVLAVVCNGVLLVWLMKGWHESTGRSNIGIAHSANRSQA